MTTRRSKQQFRNNSTIDVLNQELFLCLLAMLMSFKSMVQITFLSTFVFHCKVVQNYPVPIFCAPSNFLCYGSSINFASFRPSSSTFSLLSPFTIILQILRNTHPFSTYMHTYVLFYTHFTQTIESKSQSTNCQIIWKIIQHFLYGQESKSRKRKRLFIILLDLVYCLIKSSS